MKGIIFDYGGTLDSRGVHWSEVIWDGYLNCYDRLGVDAAQRVSKEQFREAYVHAERALARERIVLPQDNFHDLMLKKVRVEVEHLVELGLVPEAQAAHMTTMVAQYCYDEARACTIEARPVLETLATRYPMMLVSNFYGNIESVLHDFELRHFFKGVIESAVVGVRKPNPTIFKLGIDALEMEARDVLVVGDSLRKDIVPAESLGCRVLWLKGKGWTAEEDAQTHPHTITAIGQVLENLD